MGSERCARHPERSEGPSLPSRKSAGARDRRARSLAPLGMTAVDPMTYTPAELMAVVAARELRDGEVVFVGIGLPNLACNLARATHAPNLVLIYESGAVGAVPERLPVSIGDPVARDRLAHGLRHGRRVPVVPPERPDRGRLPRRRADRPLRQHQHDGRRHATSIPTFACPGAAAPPRSPSTRGARSSSAGSAAGHSRRRSISSPAPATAPAAAPAASSACRAPARSRS